MWGFCLRLDGVSLSTARRAKGQIRGGDSTPGMSASAYIAPCCAQPAKVDLQKYPHSWIWSSLGTSRFAMLRT